MYEIEIQSCIEFITCGIDCGEDSETVEETLLEIKELQEKYDFTIQELLNKTSLSDAKALCSHLRRLKFKIRKTTSAYRKNKKEHVSAQQSSQRNDIPKVTFDNSRYKTHTYLSLSTNIFSAPAEYNSYSESYPKKAAPSSLMGDSGPILPPANLTKQLTTTSADLLSTTTINNSLFGVSLGGFKTAFAANDGLFSSLRFFIRRPKLPLCIRHSQLRNRFLLSNS